jgi:cytidylate kinase
MKEHDHRLVVAIDGPAAAGKSTVALALADRLGAMLFDTGALYRAVTLAAVRSGVSGADGEQLAAIARSRKIEIQPASIADGRQVDVLLDGEDVTWSLRTPEIDARVSEVSAHPAVREELLDVQRAIADGTCVVMVGRDIGTVVIPDAGTKVFLEASSTERARRRLAELRGRGVEATYEDVLADLEARDAFDSGRATAPLVAAGDAVLVDTDGRTVDEIVTEIEHIVQVKFQETGARGG